jgi:hypothetical protein
LPLGNGNSWTADQAYPKTSDKWLKYIAFLKRRLGRHIFRAMGYARAFALLLIAFALGSTLSIRAQTSTAIRIIVDDVTVNGAPHLPVAAREQLAGVIKEHRFEGGSDAWVVKLSDMVLQQVPDVSDTDYGVNEVCAAWRPESLDSTGMHVSVTINLGETPPVRDFATLSVS